MDPDEERRDMKRKINHFKMLGYVADSEYGIPTKCPCGGRIIDEVGGQMDKDTHPGKRFFTCADYQADGLHYRQSWVFGVEEEIGLLNKRVKEIDQRLHEAELSIYSLRNVCKQIEKIEEQVLNLSVKVSEMEYMVKQIPNLKTLSLD